MRWAWVLLVPLSACHRTALPDARICENVAPKVAADDVEACLHRTSYKLARATGPSNEIAAAVVVGCRPSIAARVTKNVSAGFVKAEETASEIAYVENAERPMALFRVVQARAGRCEIE